MITVGSDFSGVGALDQALKRLKVPYRKIFACDNDKYARQTYFLNHGYPDYMSTDVYSRHIPRQPLGLYVSTPPCQTFSTAGSRSGEDDERGILFYNSHEFIKKNNPRFFIFENVKGLLSDDKKNKKDEIGRTFRKWLDYLGGKSVNGNPVIFPHQEAVPYHIYYKVLNAKHYNIPQNRERVFIVGIRDDVDNTFTWPKEEPLTRSLKDILEKDVPKKYDLSEKILKWFIDHSNKSKSKGNGFKFDPKTGDDIANTVNARMFKMGIDDNYIKIAALRGRNPEDPKSRKAGEKRKQFLEIKDENISNTITSVQKDNLVIQLNPSKESNGAQPYKQNRIYDADGISPTLDTKCGRPNYLIDYNIRRLTPLEAFRLMDFNEDFKWNVSDTQAYKQAGNSVCVGLYERIINNLILK